MEVSEAKPLNAGGYENTKLKRLVADAMLDNAALKDLLEEVVTPAGKRKAVAHLVDAHGMTNGGRVSELGARLWPQQALSRIKAFFKLKIY